MTKLTTIINFIIYVVQIQADIKYDVDVTPILPMKKLKRNLMLIKEDCGEICDTSDNFVKQPGLYFDKIVKNFNCDYLFDSPLIDGNTDVSEQQIFNRIKNGSIEAPIKDNVPEDILKLYTFDGRIKIEDSYLNDVKWVSNQIEKENLLIHSQWTKETLELFQLDFKHGLLRGGYGYGVVNNMTKNIQEYMLDQVCKMSIFKTSPIFTKFLLEQKTIFFMKLTI